MCLSLIQEGLCARGSVGLKEWMGDWVMRRDSGIWEQGENMSEDTSREVWDWAEYQESVQSGTEG